MADLASLGRPTAGMDANAAATMFQQPNPPLAALQPQPPVQTGVTPPNIMGLAMMLMKSGQAPNMQVALQMANQHIASGQR
jgi:hypothetical protein